MASFTRAELESFRDAEVPDLLGPGPPAALRRHQPGPVDRGHPDPLRAPGQPVLPRAAARRGDHRADLAVRRDDRRRPRPPPLARHRDHQPGPPRHRPRRRADRRRAAAPAARSSRRWSPGRRRGWSRSPASRRTGPRSGSRKAVLGRQPEPLAGSELWVVPNPSGLNAHETVATLAEAYAEVARAAGLDTCARMTKLIFALWGGDLAGLHTAEVHGRLAAAGVDRLQVNVCDEPTWSGRSGSPRSSPASTASSACGRRPTRCRSPPPCIDVADRVVGWEVEERRPIEPPETWDGSRLDGLSQHRGDSAGRRSSPRRSGCTAGGSTTPRSRSRPRRRSATCRTSWSRGSTDGDAGGERDRRGAVPDRRRSTTSTRSTAAAATTPSSPRGWTG